MIDVYTLTYSIGMGILIVATIFYENRKENGMVFEKGFLVAFAGIIGKLLFFNN